MIESAPSFDRLRDFAADIHVIGAGPVGLLTGLALAEKGFRVLILESGREKADPAITALSEAESYDPDYHHRPDIASARRLGGTANLWGGRCLPFDPIDFTDRPWLGLGAWPISEADLAPHLASAIEGLGAGRPVFTEALAGVAADPAFAFETLERWSNTPRTQAIHRAALEGRADLLVALGATALGFDYDEAGRIGAIDLHLEGAGRERLAASRVILAAGGNQGTRLLLAEQRRRPELFGGPEGPLGRFYMGHVNGSIADIVFENRTLHDGLTYHVDANGSYVRRRITPSRGTQEAAGIGNVAFWPVVPPILNPEHRSGPLSAVFLALTVGPLARKLIAEPMRLKHAGPPPYARGPHVMNVLRDLPATIGFAPAFLWKNRVAKMRLPGFFLTNPGRRYALEYHSEHLPAAESRLTLGESTDRLGLPRLVHELRFSQADAASVIAAHEALEGWLTRNALARLDYYEPPERRAENVFAEAKHGTHQVGTTRMGFDRTSAVVDADCRAFDVPNLFVVSTAVLPTSSQANPTLTAVQLGLRLAEHLAPRGGA
ncbi:GMC oxidoreductase [Amaricoccus solimangrovi]|uniref:GMC family oxidoreductase n=1 Tax=Amaricoccus solimangrovi TaxID=2589815 RepID=A0A501WN68_9RHOB|nr:GMC oxidoreductase [Amaricoccus solimangrovi]TPE48421.1 GMC family oxidoreductase [Amaricoccus solimangrovi]